MKLPSTPYTVSCGSATPWTGNTPSVLPNALWQSIEMSIVKIKPFATATDEEIADVVNGYYNGTFSLEDIQSVWSVGDTRTIHLNAMSSTGVGEVQPEQDIEITILGFNHDAVSDTLTTQGKNKALITLQTVPCLINTGQINSTETNNGGWKGCPRRTWCNNVAVNSLPQSIKNIVKSVNKVSSAGNMSSDLVTTSDKVFLLSENEIFGEKKYSTGNEGTQYDYYNSSKYGGSKIKKLNGGADTIWWERSPTIGYNNGFAAVTGAGTHFPGTVTYKYGLTPAFCL